MKKYLIALVALFSCTYTFAQEIKEGETIFNSNCKACHSIGQGKLVGPDLKGVQERREEAWLINFIKKPGDMIKSGDPVAKQLFEENNKILMPNHDFLSDSEIKSLIAYLGSASKAEPVVIEEKKEVVKTEIKKDGAVEVKEASASLTPLDYVVCGLVILCLVLVVMASYMIRQVYLLVNR